MEPMSDLRVHITDIYLEIRHDLSFHYSTTKAPIVLILLFKAPCGSAPVNPTTLTLHHLFIWDSSNNHTTNAHFTQFVHVGSASTTTTPTRTSSPVAILRNYQLLPHRKGAVRSVPPLSIRFVSSIFPLLRPPNLSLSLFSRMVSSSIAIGW